MTWASSKTEMLSLISSLESRMNLLADRMSKSQSRRSLLNLMDGIKSDTKTLGKQVRAVDCNSVNDGKNDDDDDDIIETKLKQMTDKEILDMIDETASKSTNDNNTKTRERSENSDIFDSRRMIRLNDFSFSIEHTALIMIDFQRDFLLNGGFAQLLGNKVETLHSAIQPAKNMLDKARQCGIKVIHTLECHLPDLSDVPAKKLKINEEYNIGDKGPMGKILIRNEYGNNIIDTLKPIKNEKIIYKPGKGAFYATTLFKYLSKNKITHLIFAGVTTEVCVFSTMCEARDRGYYCLLLTDATASYFPNFKENIIDMIVAQHNIVGWTATTDQVIAALNTHE